jgi:hypothetical protein
VIDEALSSSRCVVVLWTKTSVASSWVKNEASDALQRRRLIPTLLDAEVRIPLEFRRLQAADLSRWRGEASTPEFDQLVEAIARTIAVDPSPSPGPAPAPDPHPPAPPPRPPAPLPPIPPGPPPAPVAKTTGRRNVLIAAAVGVAVIVGVWIDRQDSVGSGPPPAPIPSSIPSPTPSPVQAPTPSPMQAPTGVAPPPAGTYSPSGASTSTNLVWRDEALRYTGTLSWDGQSTVAQLSVGVIDLATSQPLGSHQLAVSVRPEAPGRAIFSTQVPVPGDSQTAGRHSHAVNLVFERQANGQWVFARNCTGPGRCWEAGS